MVEHLFEKKEPLFVMTTGNQSNTMAIMLQTCSHTLPYFHSKTNRFEMNSHPHLNGNSVEGLPAVVSQA